MQIAAGGHHSLVLMQDGRVYGCGKNSHGELGLGEPHEDLISLEKGINEFVKIYSLQNITVEQVYAGGLHSYIVIDRECPLFGS
jgi:alpha-tubulin suppressor-like RCC1 family protein